MTTKQGWAKSRDQEGEARRSMWGVLGRFAVRESKLEQKAHWGGLDGYIRKTLSLLFVLFLLAASRKSTNSGKYHLLEKRNPFYF